MTLAGRTRAPDAICENAKLNAAGRHISCLIRAFQADGPVRRAPRSRLRAGRGSAVDLARVVSLLSSLGVTADTTFWILAWGGDGANGNVCCNFGGQGGQGGYAQTTMSVSTLEAAFGTTELYYCVGVNGTVSANAGGGAAARPAARCNDRTSRRR